jgi:hypothetical protein
MRSAISFALALLIVGAPAEAGAQAAGQTAACVGVGTLAKGFKSAWEDGATITHDYKDDQILMERTQNGKTFKQTYRKHLPHTFQCAAPTAGATASPTAQTESKYTWGAEPVSLGSLAPGKPHVDRGTFVDCAGKNHDIEVTSVYLSAGNVSIGTCTFDVHYIERTFMVDGKRTSSGWIAYNSELNWALKSRFIAGTADRDHKMISIEPK